MSAGEMEMGTKHSAMSSDATPLQGKLKPSKSFQLNLAWSVSKSYQGNLRDIANRGNHLAVRLVHPPTPNSPPPPPPLPPPLYRPLSLT
jgi:hypothetical protein